MARSLAAPLQTLDHLELAEVILVAVVDLADEDHPAVGDGVEEALQIGDCAACDDRDRGLGSGRSGGWQRLGGGQRRWHETGRDAPQEGEQRGGATGTDRDHGTPLRG